MPRSSTGGELLRQDLEQVDGRERDRAAERQDHQRDPQRAREQPAIAAVHPEEHGLGPAVDRTVRRHHQPEHSIGVRVRATTPEKKIAAASGSRTRGTAGRSAGHERERHEHRHQRGGRRDHREADLARAVEGREQRRLGRPRSAGGCSRSRRSRRRPRCRWRARCASRVSTLIEAPNAGHHHEGGDHRDRDRHAWRRSSSASRAGTKGSPGRRGRCPRRGCARRR